MYIEDRLFSEDRPEEVYYSVTMTEREYDLYLRLFSYSPKVKDKGVSDWYSQGWDQVGGRKTMDRENEGKFMRGGKMVRETELLGRGSNPDSVVSRFDQIGEKYHRVDGGNGPFSSSNDTVKKKSGVFAPRNPFDKGIFIQNYHKDPKGGRDMFIVGHQSKGSYKDFYRDYLKMERFTGADPNLASGVTRKEIKDQIRKLARRKNLQKSAIIGSGITATGAAGAYAYKKHRKNKKSD